MKNYSVKRLEPEQEISRIVVSAGTIISVTKKHVSFAVVNNKGEIVKSVNKLTGLLQHEIYSRKQTAQQVAEWMNEKY